jgi:hypothetical protein
MIPAFSACTESPEHDRIGDADHLDLALAGADRLEEDEVAPGGIEDEECLQRRLGEAAEVTARPHRADEHTGVEEVIRESDPISEQRPLRERARRIDGDDSNRLSVCANVADERADQRRLADPRRAGDPDRVRVSRLGV